MLARKPKRLVAMAMANRMAPDMKLIDWRERSRASTRLTGSGSQPNPGRLDRVRTVQAGARGNTDPRRRRRESHPD